MVEIANDEATAARSAGAACAPPSAVLDLPTLVNRCMQDHEMAIALLERFVSRLMSATAEIQRLMLEANWSAAASKAHNLKGEAGSMAAMALYRAASEVEGALRQARYNDAARALPALELAAAECVNELPAALQQLSESTIA
jgi:HPt (histidine-containing phosphotransfer) domain-containing protein